LRIETGQQRYRWVRVGPSQFESQICPKQFLVTTGITIEIKGQDKPALIAEWLTMAITG